MFKPVPKSDNQDAHRFERYVDPTGEFTNRDLQFSVWYLKHKILLREILIGFLLGFSIILGSFSLYRIFEYAIFGYSHDELQRANLTRLGVSLNASKNEVATIPLAIESVTVLPSTGGKTDFLAVVTNQNERWAAHVFYGFTWSGGETAVADAWVWPGMSNGLAVLAAPTEAVPDNAQLNIKNIEWFRLDNHNYPEPQRFVSDRLNFEAANVVFTPAAATNGAVVSRLAFSLKNTSAFGYWQMPVLAVLKKGDVVVGVKQLVIDSLAPEQEQTIELSSLNDNLDVDGVVVWPNLNLFDSAVYLPLKK